MKRNGLTGELLKESGPSSSLEKKFWPQRVRRTRLQTALKAKVPEGVIELNKRLEKMEKLTGGKGGMRLRFEDRTEVVADLVVGGDGIRSVRSPPFPVLRAR